MGGVSRLGEGRGGWTKSAKRGKGSLRRGSPIRTRIFWIHVEGAKQTVAHVQDSSWKAAVGCRVGRDRRNRPQTRANQHTKQDEGGGEACGRNGSGARKPETTHFGLRGRSGPKKIKIENGHCTRRVPLRLRIYARSKPMFGCLLFQKKAPVRHGAGTHNKHQTARCSSPATHVQHQ